MLLCDLLMLLLFLLCLPLLLLLRLLLLLLSFLASASLSMASLSPIWDASTLPNMPFAIGFLRYSVSTPVQERRHARDLFHILRY